MTIAITFSNNLFVWDEKTVCSHEPLKEDGSDGSF